MSDHKLYLQQHGKNWFLHIGEEKVVVYNEQTSELIDMGVHVEGDLPSWLSAWQMDDILDRRRRYPLPSDDELLELVRAAVANHELWGLSNKAKKLIGKPTPVQLPPDVQKAHNELLEAESALEAAREAFDDKESAYLRSVAKLVGLEHVSIGDYVCTDSPIGKCLYDDAKDQYHDECIICHGPEDRP